MTAANWLWVPFTSRRFWVRPLVLGLILSDLFFAYDKWGEVPKLHALIYFRQRECLNFRELSNRVVFESDPEKFDGMVKLDGYISNTATSTLPGGRSVALTSISASNCLDSLLRASARLDDLQATPQFPGIFFPPPTPSIFNRDPWANAGVFLHERSVPGGAARLVVISAKCDEFDVVTLCPAIYSVSPPFGEPARLTQSTDGDLLLAHSRPGLPPMRIFAGQPDANDSARFTIRYELKTGTGLVEGHLNADDSVTLRIADEPPSPQMDDSR